MITQEAENEYTHFLLYLVLMYIEGFAPNSTQQVKPVLVFKMNISPK